MSKCAACTRGPIGAEGHLDLFVFKLRGNEVQFTCRTCSMRWVRTRIGAADSWAESYRELDALTVPGFVSNPAKTR